MIEISVVRAGSRLVSLTVGPGEIVAVCGRAAGEIADLADGSRHAISGTVRVDGRDPYRDRAHVTVGRLGADEGLYGELCLDEIIGAWRSWSSHPMDEDAVAAIAGLRHRGSVPYDRLTPAERRRFDLAMVMIGRPEAIVVEEPVTWLDADGSDDMWALLRSLQVPVLVAVADESSAMGADRFVRLDPVTSQLAA